MGQVVSLTWPAGARPIQSYRLQRAFNALLPDDLSVLRLDQVNEVDHNDRPFHARHCSRGKRYRYHFWAHRIAHPLHRKTCWHLSRPPTPEGWDRAREAAALLLGTHNFQGFRSSNCTALDTVRHLNHIEIIPPPGGDDHRVTLLVQGTAFLKNMVRIIAGTLLDVAAGRKNLADIQYILETGDRSRGGRTAPAHGLLLEEVFYPNFPWKVPRWGTPRFSRKNL